MSWSAVESSVFLLAELAQIALLGVLLIKKANRSFPIFTAYIAFNTFSDVIVAVLGAVDPHARVLNNAYNLFLPLQYLLELGVLAEIARNVLHPALPSLPKSSWKVFQAMMVLALIAGVLLAAHPPTRGNSLNSYRIPLQLGVGILRMLTFVVTAAFAQMLGIGWKNRVLQLASGLSFYSAISLIVGLSESHFGKSLSLDALNAVAYSGTLAFWIWAFSTKEAQRREFTPQMQEFLVSIAGSAGRTRAALARSQMK